MPTGVGGRLLDLDGRAGGFEFLGNLVGFLFGNALFDRFGSALDEVLRLFQAETGDAANGFDDVELLLAEVGKDDVEFGLLLGSGGSRSSAGGAGNGDGSGGNAELLFERLHEVGEFKNGETLHKVKDLGGLFGSH